MEVAIIYVVGVLVTSLLCAFVHGVTNVFGDDTPNAIPIVMFWPVALPLGLAGVAVWVVCAAGNHLGKSIATRKERKALAARERDRILATPLEQLVDELHR